MIKTLPFLFVISMIIGCGGSKPQEFEIKYAGQPTDADTTIDLSGSWNDVDSRMVAQEMIEDCLTHPWLNNHVINADSKPVVIVGGIRNKSIKHIHAATLISEIERAFINIGKIRLVFSKSERGTPREERADQGEFAAMETLKQMGRKLGADYMMTGQIYTIEDRGGGNQVIVHQTYLTLTNIETNEKVWIGRKKIKKFIQGADITRIDPDTTIDLSGRWNNADSHLVAEGMIKDCLDHPWLNNHVINAGSKPFVIVGNIRDKSIAHIPVVSFIIDIERAFINTGKIRVVSGPNERGELRGERADQAEFAALETVKRMGLELGADYMMAGEISTIEDHQVITYRTDLMLTNIETNKAVWIGQTNIKKFIVRNKLKP